MPAPSSFTSSEKIRLRQELLRMRRSLEWRVWLDMSSRVASWLNEVPEIRKAARVHCYVSIESSREVNTLPVLGWLLSEGKEVYMPYIEGDETRSARYSDGQGFRTGLAGPPVPELFCPAVEERFDVVILPVVGVDAQGNRIGYGRGWYDRFLAGLASENTRSFRIGLAFGFQMLSRIPADPWDQPLDLVVTENGIIRCSQQRK